MKRAALILLLTASPAVAGDGPFGRRDCEPRGPVFSWPEVRAARAAYNLCPAQDLALIAYQKAMLDAATPSMFRPSYATNPVPAPALAPPPPAIPTPDRPANAGPR